MRHPIWIFLWLGLFVLFLIAFLTKVSSLVIWTTAGVLIVALGVLIFVVEIRARLAIQRDISAGRPLAVLDRVESMLEGQKGRRNRGPLLLHKASALTLQGRWDEALHIVKGIGVDDFPRAASTVWQNYHASIAFDCLMFLGRAPDAKALFNARIAPLAEEAGERYSDLLTECRAMIAYQDGEPDRARELFHSLLEPPDRPQVVRAYCHYFLGLIEEQRGTIDMAHEHFERVVKLAPETVLGVRSIEARQRLSALSLEPPT